MRQTLLILTALATVLPSAAPAWTRSAAGGEIVWEEASPDGLWLARVSEARARLVYVGPADGLTNLLFEPDGPRPVSRGGHRFWLGPQAAWPKPWPPPDDWEERPAAGVSVMKDTGALRVEATHDDPRWPPLARVYQWSGDTLLLRAEWPAGGTPYQGIHILQLPADARVEVAPATQPVTLLPHAGRPAPRRLAAPPESWPRSPDGAALWITRTGDEEKLGFAPQPLQAFVAGHALSLAPATYEGQPLGNVPDAGHVTQVYLGATAFPLVEIEQLTPLLDGEPGTLLATTVAVTVRRTARPRPRRTARRGGKTRPSGIGRTGRAANVTTRSE